MRSLPLAACHPICVRRTSASRKYNLLKDCDSLDCGHLFCYQCVAEHLVGIHDTFIHASPEYQPIPPDLLQALRNPLMDLARYFTAIRQRRENPGPRYDCPTCERTLKHRPAQVFDQGTLRATFGAYVAPDASMDVEGVGAISAVKGRGDLFAEYPLL